MKSCQPIDGSSKPRDRVDRGRVRELEVVVGLAQNLQDPPGRQRTESAAQTGTHPDAGPGTDRVTFDFDKRGNPGGIFPQRLLAPTCHERVIKAEYLYL